MRNVLNYAFGYCLTVKVALALIEDNPEVSLWGVTCCEFNTLQNVPKQNRGELVTERCAIYSAVELKWRSI